MPEQLLPVTPSQTVGPFFHHALAFDHSNELVSADAPGSVRLHGVVLDGAGQPITDAAVEIRQADADGTVPAATGSLQRPGTAFTGWGRFLTDAEGAYSFTTLEPGVASDGAAAFFSVLVYARGVVNGLFTRAYLPEGDLGADPFLASLPPERRDTLVARREADGSLRFDIHLQGDLETVFVTFPAHGPR